MALSKHIPNSITSLNLLCGAVGVIFATRCRLDLAFLMMLGGAVFDFCDGLSARALKAYSPMGRELDSLADDITFGLLPGVMLLETMSENGIKPEFLCWIPLLIPVFSGLRLAKFNIDERQTSSFIGLPTPACAMICGSMACLVSRAGVNCLTQAMLSPWFIPTMSVILSLLLVCEIPMFSFKFHKGDKLGTSRIAFIAIALLSVLTVLVLGWNIELAILISFTAYIIINVAAFVCGPKQRKQE